MNGLLPSTAWLTTVAISKTVSCRLILPCTIRDTSSKSSTSRVRWSNCRSMISRLRFTSESGTLGLCMSCKAFRIGASGFRSSWLSIARKGRDQKHKIGAAHGRQRGNGSRYHSHEYVGEKNLVNVAVRRKKEKTAKTPEHTVGGDSVEIMTPPAARFRVRRRCAQVCSARRVTATCDQKNRQQPTYKYGPGNLSPQHSGQDERIKYCGKESVRELFV